jgi:hypothetical protein
MARAFGNWLVSGDFLGFARIIAVQNKDGVDSF